MSTYSHASSSHFSFADRWKPQAQCWGSRYGTPPPAHVILLLSPRSSPSTLLSSAFALKQKEQPHCCAGRPHNLAAGGGSLRLLKDKSSPAFDTKWKQAHMQYSSENYKAGSSETWHLRICWNFAWALRCICLKHSDCAFILGMWYS